MSLSQVSSEISGAINASDRPERSVELIAVSKVQPNERVLKVLNQGHRVFRLAQELGHCPPLFMQVNTGNETQKAGIAPDSVDDFVAECRLLDLPLAGLMCIPPVHEEASLHFALLAKLAKRNDLSQLSMGMSGDFAKAISFGATHVRVGSAIFGERTFEPELSNTSE